jgi:hypothetical protein
MASEAVAGSSSAAVGGLHHHLLQAVTASAGYHKLDSFPFKTPGVKNKSGIAIFLYTFT